jgi:hypothetical protein
VFAVWFSQNVITVRILILVSKELETAVLQNHTYRIASAELLVNKTDNFEFEIKKINNHDCK